MSCWIVTKRHIDALAMLIDAELKPLDGHDVPMELRRKAIGMNLMIENNNSYNYRYDNRYKDECHDVFGYEWEDPKLGKELENPYYVLKAIGCYDYQSCEHPGWEASWSNRILDRLREHVIDRMPSRPWEGRTSQYSHDGKATYHDMPEYDQADAWDIPNYEREEDDPENPDIPGYLTA